MYGATFGKLKHLMYVTKDLNSFYVWLNEGKLFNKNFARHLSKAYLISKGYNIKGKYVHHKKGLAELKKSHLMDVRNLQVMTLEEHQKLHHLTPQKKSAIAKNKREIEKINQNA